MGRVAGCLETCVAPRNVDQYAYFFVPLTVLLLFLNELRST